MASMLLEPYWIAGFAVRSFVVLILTAGIAAALRRCSAACVHGVWAVGTACCLATPIVAWLSPSWTLPILPLPTTEAAERPDIRIDNVAASVAVSRPTPARVLDSAATDRPTVALRAGGLSASTRRDGQNAKPSPLTVATVPVKRLSLETIVLTFWAAGFFLVLLRTLSQWIAARGRLRQAVDLDDEDWRNHLDAVAHLLDVRSDVAMKRHSGSVSPMVIGLRRPVVLLPDDVDTWSHESRKLVLLHELAHVRRRDVLTQLTATTACAVYWFNPLVWWGAAQMRRLREFACDDVAVALSGAPFTYAQTLLDVAKRYRCRPSGAVAMARSSHVEKRIASVLSSTRSRAALSTRSMGTLLAVAAIVAVSVGSCRVIARADDSDAPEVEQAVASVESTESRTMQVSVLDETGKPLPGAKILVGIWELQEAKEYPNRKYTTDDQGRAEVAMPSRLRIMRMWPAKEGYVPLFVNFASGTHEEGRLIPDEYEFRLPKGERLSGRVVDGAGAPIANAKVQVLVDVDEPAWGVNPEAIISTWLANGGDAAVTDAEGRWSINNAPAAPEENESDFEFRLQVTHPEFAGDTRWGELQQQQGITTKDLRAGDAELTLDPGVAVSGHVTDPKGDPVRKGLVIWSDHPYWATGVNETQIDKTGHFTTKRLAPGKYPITVLAPGFAPWQNTIDVYREIGDVNVQLEPGHSVRIQFVNQAGTPIPDVSVSIGEWRGTEALYNYKHPNVPDSGIPRRADADGVYEWTWAPDDAVTYRVGATGFAGQEVALVAKPSPHTIELAARRTVTGFVTDASTGEPIKSFRAMPVIVFRPDFYHTRRTDAKVGRDGRYEVPLTGSGDANDRYRVRFEAEGYASAVSDESFGPLDGRATLDFTLQPASPRSGRIVDADGRPVENAAVLQASPTEVPRTSNGRPETYDSHPFPTDAQGRFRLPATTEPVRVRAYHDFGFAERTVEADQESVGLMKLQPWASVSGRLVQAGRPVAGQSVMFHPLIRQGLTEARFQDSYYDTTDADGRFRLDRIPPLSGTLKAHLGPWRESPLTSSEAIPLKLSAGERRDVVLGGDGATITGRVVATGRSNDEFSKQWSLNYLVSRESGVDYPDEGAPLSFSASGGIQPRWLRQPDFQSWLATRRHHFVKLSDDGRLAVHGVASGRYDLVIQLYEQPAGCLIETIGERVIPVVVSAEQVESGLLDVGDVQVRCRIGPRVGSDMRAFKITDGSGRVRHVDDMSGRFVLLHAWSTSCAPCITSMPTLKAAVERYSNSPLIVVGLNVDDDAAAAKQMASAQGMDWAQNYLGPDSDFMRQLAVSSIPAYYLIGPDGTLIRSANEWEIMEKALDDEVE